MDQITIADARAEGAGEALRPGERVLPEVILHQFGFLVAREADENEPTVVAEGRLDVLERGHLGEAAHAPGRPEVDQDELALVVAQLEPGDVALAAGADPPDVEIRRQVAGLDGLEQLGCDRPVVEVSQHIPATAKLAVIARMVGLVMQQLLEYLSRLLEGLDGFARLLSFDLSHRQR